MSRFILGLVGVLWLAVCSFSSNVRADGDDRVLFLTIADNPKDVEWENLFAADLKLVFDEAEVIAVSSDSALSNGQAFALLPTSQQVAKIRPLLKRHSAFAAIWVLRSNENIIIHVAFASKARAIIKTIEAKPDTSSSHLAAAARELSHSFDVQDNHIDKWGVFLAAVAKGAISEHKGPNTWLGGTLGLRLNLTHELSLRAWLGALGGPTDSAQALEVSGFGLQGGLGAAYLWKLGPFALGPMFGLQSEWSTVSLVSGIGGKERFTEWQAQLLANIEINLQVTRVLYLMIGGGAVFTPYQDSYTRTSDNLTAYMTPFVSWNALLGITLFFN